MPRSCPAGVPEPPDPLGSPRVIAKTPGTAARLHLPVPGSWVPLDPRTEPRGWRSGSFFISLAKLCLKRGARPWPPGALCACSSVQPGSLPRALSGSRCRQAQTLPLQPPSRSALEAAICCPRHHLRLGKHSEEKGGFSLSGTLLGTTRNVQPQEDARRSVERRRCRLSPEFDQT